MSSAGAELAVRLPLDSLAAFPALLRHLEARRVELGVSSFGMAVASVEDVFMAVASETEGGGGGGAPASGATPAPPLEDSPDQQQQQQQQQRQQQQKQQQQQQTECALTLGLPPSASGSSAQEDALLLPPPSAPPHHAPHHAHLLASRGLGGGGGSSSSSSGKDGVAAVRRLARVDLGFWEAFARHAAATYVKRACYARRDIRAVCCLLLVPLATLLVGLGLLAASFRGDPVPMQLSTAQFNSGGQGRARAIAGFTPLVSGAPLPPNYVPAFAFATAGAPSYAQEVPSAVVQSIYSAVPAANLSSDPGRADLGGGGLLLSPAAAEAVGDPLGFEAEVRAELAVAAAAAATAPRLYPALPYARMSTFLLLDRGSYAASKYGAYVFTANGSAVPLQSPTAALGASNVSTLGIFFNSSAQHAAPIFTNLATSAMASVVGAGQSIATRSNPLPLTSYEMSRRLAGQSFGAVMVLCITMAYIPAAFAQFLVREREVSAKHQMTLSGISLPGYWVANFCFDYTTYLVPLCLVLAIFQGFLVGDFISEANDRLPAFVLLLLGYGGAATSFTYLLSHAFASPSSAQAAVAMLNIIFFAAVIAAFVLLLLPNTCYYVPPMRWALSLLPIYALGDGLSSMANMLLLPGLQRQCDVAQGIAKPPSAYPAYKTALHMDIVGVPLCYLAAETLLYFALALGVDVLRTNMRFRRGCLGALRRVLPCGACAAPVAAASPAASPAPSPAPAAPTSAPATTTPPFPKAALDPDVAAEAARIDAALLLNGAGLGDAPGGTTGRHPSAPAPDVITLSHLRKVYPGGKVAVEDLSFGCGVGEVFGFLGINGAGKTSTLQMLTGDALPSAGGASLAGYDIIEQQLAVRRLVGYCPQFDALLDLLSVREHLQLYARIKGIDEGALPGVVADALRDFDLGEYADKLAGSLSGGNKRKTSVACALIGAPPIVFLDEASTGVDPVARRKLWTIISRISTTQRLCTIILTTHSMEEVEALCTRIGIMVGGRLRCLGSAQHLRSTHGAGFSAELRLAPPSAQGIADVARRIEAAGHCSQGVLLPPSATGSGGGSAAAAAESAVLESSVGSIAGALGQAERAGAVTETGSGWALAAAFGRCGAAPRAVALSTFAAWWAGEDEVGAVVRGMEAAFPGCAVVERQGLTLKVRVPPTAAPLADLFERLEGVKSTFGLTSATLSQTTLEQVFNRFAALQEEAANPRGMA